VLEDIEVPVPLEDAVANMQVIDALACTVVLKAEAGLTSRQAPLLFNYFG
jgi:hypothetical protein